MAEFIVFEGLDGAGTTTQAKLLAELFRGRGGTVLLTNQPSSGPIGKMIRKMLSREIERETETGPVPIDSETLALMYAADRLDHLAREIEPARKVGVVICDRYYGSSFAYQGDEADDGSFNTEWVVTLNSRAREPDMTIFLDVPAKICLQRIADRDTTRDIFENLPFLEKLEDRYHQVLAELENRGEKVARFDGTQPIDALHEHIRVAVDYELK